MTLRFSRSPRSEYAKRAFRRRISRSLRGLTFATFVISYATEGHSETPIARGEFKCQ